MNNEAVRLELHDIKVGSDIDVIDHLRGHGIHGHVTKITTENSGQTTVEFFDPTTGRYAWHATAMGLIPGTGSFWRTYRRSRVFDKEVTFGYLNSYGSKTA